MFLYRSLVLASSVLIGALGWTYAAHAASNPTTATADDDQQDTPTPTPATPAKQNFVRTYDGKTNQPQSARAVPVIINSDDDAVTAPTSTSTTTKPAATTATVDLKKPIDRHALAYINRGSELLHKAQFDLAIADLNKALEIDKNSVDARRFLALALLSKQLPAQALDQLNIVIKANPSSYDHQLVGQAYLAQYQNLEAAAAYKESLRIDQSNEYSRGGLATAYAYQGDFPGAFKIIQEGMQRSKNNAGWSAYFKRLMEDISKLKSSPDPYKFVERNAMPAGVIDPTLYQEKSQGGGG